MSDSLKRRMLKYEELPPADTWNRIEAGLANEFVADDAALSHKLDEYSVAPPADAWSKIALELDGETQPVQPAKRIPMTRRLAIAASVLVILIAGSFYFLSNNRVERNAASQQVSQTIAPRRASVPPSTVDSQARTTEIVSSSPAGTDKTQVSKTAKPPRRNLSFADSRIQPAEALQVLQPEPVPEASASTPQVASALQPIAVSAPPIRDESGNIIMDMNVISKPGQPYITVTSPNGNQTRISNKFLDCLRFLNSNLNAYDADGNNCRVKFEEWRNKLISEAAYIPAGDNFFDIFELKEIIED